MKHRRPLDRGVATAPGPVDLFPTLPLPRDQKGAGFSFGESVCWPSAAKRLSASDRVCSALLAAEIKIHYAIPCSSRAAVAGAVRRRPNLAARLLIRKGSL